MLQGEGMQQQVAKRPFEGFVMSTSGGSASDKKRLAELITQGGGIYSKDLTRACTHLLIKPATKTGPKLSDKEKAAREWGTTRVLSEVWVSDTMAAGRAISEAPYIVPPPGPPKTPERTSPPQPESTHHQQVQPAYGAASHELRHTGAQHQQQQQPAGLPPQRSGLESYYGRIQPVARRPAAFAIAQHVQQEAAIGHAETQRYASKVPDLAGSQEPSVSKTATSNVSAPQPSGVRPEQSDGDFLSSGRSPQALHRAPAPSTSGRDWRQPMEDCEPYLDGLRLYVACAAPTEFMELVSICREGGACRYPRLHPLITHIVVGSDRLANELACIKQHQQRHSALVRVLDADWLRACSASRSRIAENEHLLGPAALLPRTSASARDLVGMQSDREATRGAWDGDTTRHGSMSLSEEQSRAFIDCWFTLAALENDPELQKHMRNVIRKAGGRIFDAGRLNLVTNTNGAYAVCPFGFPARARREALRHADFKKVPEANYVTAYWVELSEKEMKPVRELGHKRVTCAPLPYHLPLPGMSAVKVTSSNMEDDEKAIIIELVNHLGGKYTAKMSRSNTHLIVDRAFGQKWANAEAFGVKAVTTDWLVDSAKAGKLLPERDYVPSAPVPGEISAAAATQFPFELTARPVESIPQAPEAHRARPSRHATSPPLDPVLSAACQQDVRKSYDENDPLEALLREGATHDRKGEASSPKTSRAGLRSKLQEMKASLSNQSHMESKEPAAKEGEQSEVWEAATRLGNYLEAVAPPMLHGSQLEVHDIPQRSASAGGVRTSRQVSNLGDASAASGLSRQSEGSMGMSPNRKRLRGSLSGINSAGNSARQSARAAALAEAASAQQYQCSQQVGYGEKPATGVSTRRRTADNLKSNLVAGSNAGEKLAKQRLAEAMRSSRSRDGASGDDALKAVLGFAE